MFFEYHANIDLMKRQIATNQGNIATLQSESADYATRIAALEAAIGP